MRLTAARAIVVRSRRGRRCDPRATCGPGRAPAHDPRPAGCRERRRHAGLFRIGDCRAAHRVDDAARPVTVEYVGRRGSACRRRRARPAGSTPRSRQTARFPRRTADKVPPDRGRPRGSVAARVLRRSRWPHSDIRSYVALPTVIASRAKGLTCVHPLGLLSRSMRSGAWTYRRQLNRTGT